jgi:hypothetical protein
MQKIIILLTAILCTQIACNKQFTADEIIQKCITQHGGEKYNTLQTKFNFRENTYTVQHQNGLFTYSKILNDSTIDILTNDGFTRFVNQQKFTMDSIKAFQAKEALNSVIYFSLLPYGLNGPAVYKKLLGEYAVGQKKYYVIQITFDANGGGTDYEDVFYYWIEKEYFSLNYFAYVYHTNGGGVRIRAAKDIQKVNGVVFQNYDNYKMNEENPNFDAIQKALQNQQITKVSEIVNEFENK